jgi:hypothetical protein
MNTKKLFLGAAIAMMVSTAQAATTAEVVCSYAPSQSPTVNRITAAAGGAGAGASAILSATGLQFVTHSGGGYILTGSGGYVAGTLLSPILVPTVIVVSLAVVGGTVALELTCAPRNHPQAVERAKEITVAFNKEVRAANQVAIEKRDATWSQIKELNEVGIVRRDTAITQAQEANKKAIVIRDRVFAGIFN